MKNLIIWALLLCILGGLGFLGWKIFFPDEKEKIRELVTQLDAAADISPGGKPLSNLNAGGALTDLFTRDLEIVVDRGGGRKMQLKGKDSLLQAVMGAQNMGAVVNVQLKDPVIELLDGDRAKVQLTAMANQQAGAQPIVQMLDIEIVKDGGDWKVRKVGTMETFKRLE